MTEALAHPGTSTTAFGVGRRENHDASAFYARFTPPTLSLRHQPTPTPSLPPDRQPGRPRGLDRSLVLDCGRPGGPATAVGPDGTTDIGLLHLVTRGGLSVSGR